MDIKGRITNFVADVRNNRIYAGDDKGLLYAFDLELQLISRSPSTTHGIGLHCLALDDKWIYSRDIAGNIVRWRKADLSPVDFAVSQHFTRDEMEEGAEPVPSASNAIACVGSALAVCNAYGTVSIFDRNDFTFAKAIRMTTRAFPEHIHVLADASLLVSDTAGRIYRGDLTDKEFKQVEAVEGFAIHSIVFDSKYNRYWGTSDRNGGIFLLDENFKFVAEHRFTNDDVEQLAIDSTCTRAYVGCFDHYVHVFRNDETPEEIGYIGPFKFQVNHIAMLDDDRLIVSLESGELHIVDVHSGSILSRVGGTNAFWDICVKGDTVYCCAEHGNIEKFDIDSRGSAISLIRSTTCKDLGYGRVRRFAPTEGGFLCATTSGAILNVSEDGTVRWSLDTGGILRDVAIDRDGVYGVACNEVGEIVKFQVADGKIVARKKNHKPTWSIAFDDDGHIVYGERSLYPAKEEREPSRMVFLDKTTLKVVNVINNAGNHKRIRILDDHKLLVNGNGNIGVQIIDTSAMKSIVRFNDWVVNTPENALIVGKRLFVITYGYQLITYDLESNETVDVQFVAEGYPKGIAFYENKDGLPFLLIGGRNCLMAFRIDNDAPELVLTRYLYDTGNPVSAGALSFEPTYVEKVRMDKPKMNFKRTLGGVQAAPATEDLGTVDA